MIPGIDGEHRWYPPGSGAVAVILNQKLEADGVTEIWPWFKVRRITGLYALGDPQDVRENRVGEDGEIARLGRRRGKTVVYEGTIKARSRKELLECVDELSGAFADMTGEGMMVLSWHGENPDLGAEDAMYFMARALTCDVVDEQTTSRHERPFVVSLRLSNPVVQVVP